jgi:hypothetical protein
MKAPHWAGSDLESESPADSSTSMLTYCFTYFFPPSTQLDSHMLVSSCQCPFAAGWIR